MDNWDGDFLDLVEEAHLSAESPNLTLSKEDLLTIDAPVGGYGPRYVPSKLAQVRL
ncbi:hypothetical protein ACRQ5Q_10160 [Bradyrhizobium sp. PMVTL-01]|uniref:hypothetical protein n=1 Tax=Bradyrhizobium sp. PMVTL-01 TaxID=3434999 RepID=UPI003F6F9539